VRRRTTGDEQVGEGVDHVRRGELPCHPDRQRLARELVHHAQHPELPPIPRPVLDEVVGPDMVGPLRPQPDAGAVRQPQPATLWLALRHLQPLATPDARHPFAVHRPARIPQQRRDPPIAVPSIPLRQFDNVRRQRGFILPRTRRLPLRRSVLPQHRAGRPLRHAKLAHDVLDADPRAGQGSPLSRSRFLQDYLLERQIGHRLP